LTRRNDLGAESRRSFPGTWSALLFYAGATIVLTWPLCASRGMALAARGDYALNLWNFWWLRQVFTHEGAALYWTDALFYPVGVSLARHELSLLNAGAGALLTSVIEPNSAFSLLTGIHFWLSAWAFFLFARTVTSSRMGALLSGLFWSFSPFHFYYLAQLNVSTLEFLPLVGWCMVRSYRKGGVVNTLGVALSAGLLAATSSYYVVYAALLGAGLLAGGRYWAPEVPWRKGAPRLALAAAAAALAVAWIDWPLLRGGLQGTSVAELVDAASRESRGRSNDLLGFLWVGPPESLIVSWPTMLGWSALALAALGTWRDGRKLFWLALALAFGVLSLGPTLHIAGRDTGWRLPYSSLSELPALWMLRKPDRMFALVQIPVGVLIAFGWNSLATRLPSNRRVIVAATFAILLTIERLAIPLATYPVIGTPYSKQLAAEDDVRAVVHLPHGGGAPADGRANLLQTRHGKAIAQGYVVDLTLGPKQAALAKDWARAFARLDVGDGKLVGALARRDAIDRVILHKTIVQPRSPGDLDDAIVFAPFALVQRKLVTLRQQGPTVEVPMASPLLARRQAALAAELGAPVYDDEVLSAYRVNRGG
jgi:hypothetical protein